MPCNICIFKRLYYLSKKIILMKKLLLLAVTIITGFGANAQQAGALNISGGANSAVDQYQIRNDDFRPSAKSTIAGSRWYNHSSVVDFLTGGSLMQFRLFPIWFDSTVKQNFTSGLGTINYISAAQIIDPIHFTLWNDPNVFDPNLIAIEPETSYKVDSISFSGAYITNANRPVTIVDTFIVSVSPSSTSTTNLYSYYYTTPALDAWAATYNGNPAPEDTLKGFTIHRTNTDVVNRASNVGGRVMWKVPIDSSVRQQDSAGFVSIVNFTLPVEVNGVPGVCNIPAGYGVAVTVTFKSGDVIIPNTDTFSEYHNFMLLSGEALGTGTPMPYYHYQYRDRNSSNLMFASNDSAYFPTLFIEGNNQPTFRNEFHDIDAHIVCDDCPTVAEYASVKNINNAVYTEAEAYPNPAANEVNITFAINQNTNATVSVTNAIGQVIATQKVNAVSGQSNKVTFSTADLSAGVYFYTLEAKGQRTTSRFVVAH